MPTNTDLVTDLPADFEVFGQAVDTSLADLKGGTTGQILSKATNTDMDFTWITNDVGDITSVTATSPLTGGGTSGAITVGIQDATTSVKGSVQLSDSTSTTSSVLAATPTAVKSAYDLAALASPAAAAFYAGKNRCLNSNMSVWQRGTSFTTTSAVYTADRWYAGIASAGTVTRQTTSDTTNLPFIQYCLRYQRTAASTSTSDLALSQSFETVNSIPLVGKAVAFSFYARKGANYSATSDLLTARLVTGTGTDQNLYSGYTGQATAVQVNATLTTTWQRFTGTITIATSVTEMGVQFFGTPTGTAGAADYYEITGIQLEVGSTASPFAPNAATYQAEVAACQRYYYRTVVTTGSRSGSGYNTSTAGGAWVISFPVSMRTAPSALETSGTAADYAILHGNFTVTNCNAVPVFVAGTLVNGSCTATVASGLTAGQGSLLYANNSNAYLGWSAEL